MLFTSLLFSVALSFGRDFLVRLRFKVDPGIFGTRLLILKY